MTDLQDQRRQIRRHSVAESVTRVWEPRLPIDVLATLGPLRRGWGDPAHRVDSSGTFWWAARTPLGIGTLAVRGKGDTVSATAWGLGANWLVDQLPTLLGENDDWSLLDLRDQPFLAQTLRANPGLRLPRTGLVLDSLIPAILRQRVTGPEARRACRSLLYRYGEAAPGPTPGRMRVPPSAEALRSVPSWQWHRFGVDPGRARTVVAAATVASRLEECAAMTAEAALARLRLVPGVGQWTAAETVQRALGDPDTVSVGDYHIHDLVVFALTGRPRGDDAEMLRLLEPWAGQRQRVVALIEFSRVEKPRFGPRYAPLDLRAM